MSLYNALTPPMNPADARVEEVFHAALEISDRAAREAFLLAECAGDPSVDQRVRRLIDAHEATQGLREIPPLAPEIETHLARMRPEKPGDRIGPYKLLQQIGEGGFGIVWMAEQEQPIRRRVALKVIKAGMDTREVIARFEQERQALAMMDHPNIAKVFDADATQLGRPFFVMELVRGIKITDYCDQASLPMPERLELFMQVCHAVQHAHQKGIIHRDLKPSNILVTLHDGVPVPKVIDFGVAKATQRRRLTDLTLFTQFEQMIGTPVYMSPEQAEMSGLDIDTRSDIYSLGVLLYELLTGCTPFDPEKLMRKGLDEIRRAIREQEPQKPSTFVSTMAVETRTAIAQHRRSESTRLAGLIQGDLDWIVMKALEKDRSRRYETANGLALDIQRHLQNEPVVARPPSRLYRFRKFAARNKGAFSAGAAVLLALLAGLGVSVWQAVRAQRGEALARAAFDDLRASAPAFAAQARALIAKEQFDEALEKLDYAIKLRPDVAGHTLAKADLLQSQLRFGEAAALYRAALRLDPRDSRAQANAALCDELQAELATRPKLSRESLVRFLNAMAGEHRSAAEMLTVGRLIGEEKKLLLDYWIERLQDLPIPPEKPLKERLTMEDDGQLFLDLSDTSIVDLRPLSGMPLGLLALNRCADLVDLRPLAGLPLKRLGLAGTKVTDLSPLATLRTLEMLNLKSTPVRDISALRGLPLTILWLDDTGVSDITVLRGMPLEDLVLKRTPVRDLSPLAGLPLRELDLTGIAAEPENFSFLAGLPLETLIVQGSRFVDLSILRGMPLKQLIINQKIARNYAALADLKSLETLILPAEAMSLPRKEIAAIEALRKHPTLRQIELGVPVGDFYISGSLAKDAFWARWDREAPALAALEAGRYTEAEPALAEAVEKARTPTTLSNLANCRAWSGQYAASAPLYRELASSKTDALLTVDETIHWFSFAMTSLAAGDTAAYRASCSELIERYKGSTDAGIAQRVLFHCVQTPDAGVSDTEIRRLIELSRPMENKKNAYWYHLTVGLAEYRAGHFAAATEAFRKVGEFPDSAPTTYADVTLAMIAHREGKFAGMQARFDRARATIAANWPLPQNAENNTRFWYYWLGAWLLLKEADALMAGDERP